MDITALRFFKTLFETRSLTYSAGQLGISQAGASRQLVKLRAIFQDPLFLRSRYGMVPTSRSEQLFPKITTMLAQMEQLTALDDFDPKEISRTLRIGAADNAVFAVLSKVFADILRQAPHLQMEILPLSQDLYARLENGSIDLAISPLDPLPPDFHKFDLIRDEYTCVARQGHPLVRKLKRGTPPTLAEVRRYRRIAITPYGNRQGPVVDGLARPDKNHAPVALWSPYFLGAPLFLLDTDLLLLLPKSTAAFFCGILPLTMFPYPVQTRKFSVRLVWHHRTHNDPTLQWVRGIFRQHIHDGTA